MRRVALVAAVAGMLGFGATPSDAVAPQDFTFTGIEGGTYSMAAWKRHPVLVVNTASLCGFTPQYAGLQKLYDTYKARGLVVLAVPSDDFNQELGSNAQVHQFCEANFALTLPMSEISHVTGPQAIPFYKWMAAEHGFTPGWNFNKVLIGPDGQVVGTWGSLTGPDSPKITGKIEALLN